MAKKRSIRQPAGRSSPSVSVRAHTQEGERRTIVKIHGKRAKTPKAVPFVPPGPAMKKLAALNRLREERRYLRGLLNASERWLPFIGFREQGLDPQSALDRVRGRIAAIREMEEKAEAKCPSRIYQATHAMTREEKERIVAAEMAEHREAGRQRIYGTVDYATSQMCYLPDPEGPTGNCPVVAYRLEETQEGIPYWEPVWPVDQLVSAPSHAAGFAAYQKAPGSILLDPWYSLWFTPCFQFRFPRAPWDCTLSWELIISVLCGFEIDTEHGSVMFEPVFCAQPSTGSFPKFEEMIWVYETVRYEESLPLNVKRCSQFPLNGGFSVKAGAESSLYVGLSIRLDVIGGCVGIPSCSEGKEADINDPLWDMGLIEVFWDTGRSGIHRYQHGVKYEMIPH